MGNPFTRTAVASASGGGGSPQIAAAPAGYGSGGGVSFSAAQSEIGEAMAGRISLAILNTLVIFLVLFYIWTRKAQGGG